MLSQPVDLSLTDIAGVARQSVRLQCEQCSAEMSERGGGRGDLVGVLR
jgi:hypothetical protein